MATFLRHPETQRRTVEHVSLVFGEHIQRLLSDPLTSDVVLNPPRPGEDEGRLWWKRVGSEWEEAGTMHQFQAHRILAAVASTLGQAVTQESPIIEGELLLDGSRFSGGRPPVATGCFFAIRRHASLVYTCDDLVARGCMTPWQRQLIEQNVDERKNIIIAGATGSGKTTLLNTVLDVIVQRSQATKPNTRLLIIEDTSEIQTNAENVLLIRSTQHVSSQELLAHAMREAPDRVMLGELRHGSTALQLLKAWNTGHNGGVTTLHCDTARPDAALDRIELLLLEVAATPMQRLIAAAVSLILLMENRKIVRAVEVQGWTGQRYLLEEVG